VDEKSITIMVVFNDGYICFYKKKKKKKKKKKTKNNLYIIDKKEGSIIIKRNRPEAEASGICGTQHALQSFNTRPFPGVCFWDSPPVFHLYPACISPYSSLPRCIPVSIYIFFYKWLIEEATPT